MSYISQLLDQARFETSAENWPSEAFHIFRGWYIVESKNGFRNAKSGLASNVKNLPRKARVKSGLKAAACCIEARDGELTHLAGGS